MKRISAEEYGRLFFSSHETGSISAELYLTESDDLVLPHRDPAAHKYSFGRALIIAGSKGFSGAAVLAANACERSGAGVTTLMVPESIYTIAASKCDGTVVAPMPADGDGCFSSDHIDEVLRSLEKADACALGPGIRTGTGAEKLVANVIENSRCPVVLDADAITICGRYPELIDACESPVILTPHEGEFVRIGGDLSRVRLYGAEKFVEEHPGTILILKGCGTVVAAGEKLYVNPSGNPGMAKGGSGDVLCGILCALLAQGFDPVFSTRFAAYLHGAAGDSARDEKGEYSVIPSDIIDNVPGVLKTLIHTDK